MEREIPKQKVLATLDKSTFYELAEAKRAPNFVERANWMRICFHTKFRL